MREPRHDRPPPATARFRSPRAKNLSIPPSAGYIAAVRVKTLTVSDFKGVEARLPWAAAVVLFGANDSGKTNILEALASFFAEETARVR
jgi:hypothetical protein